MRRSWVAGKPDFIARGIAAPAPGQLSGADLEVVAGDYFPAFKMPLLRGRTFRKQVTPKVSARHHHRSGNGRAIFSGRRSSRQAARG